MTARARTGGDTGRNRGARIRESRATIAAVVLLAILLAILLAPPTAAAAGQAEDEDLTARLKIKRVIHIEPDICIALLTAVGEDGYQFKSDSVDVHVVTNSDDWQLGLRVSLADEVRSAIPAGQAICRLMDPAGRILTEVPVTDREIVLSGVGGEGSHHFVLQVVGRWERPMIEELPGLVINLQGH
ncbi:MAG: hypothetical protein JW819_13365 [Candidatus Krumholzibacteriota bacterium]|nr:hypothetical protein [Candidatus Krumholzibacteriota bacterium]